MSDNGEEAPQLDPSVYGGSLKEAGLRRYQDHSWRERRERIEAVMPEVVRAVEKFANYPSTENESAVHELMEILRMIRS